MAGDNNNPAASSGVQILYPILMDCSFDRADLDDEAERGESDPTTAEGFYGGTIKMLPEYEDIHAAQCDFRAGLVSKGTASKSDEDLEIFSVSAIYLVAFRGDGLSAEIKRSILEQSATAAAWPLFRTLFSVVSAQSSFDSKPLPNSARFDWVVDEAT